jgi:hypothetical protein
MKVALMLSVAVSSTQGRGGTFVRSAHLDQEDHVGRVVQHGAQ